MISIQKDRFNTGFQMTFENGWTVSVQLGRGNYCSNRDYGRTTSEEGIPFNGADAEIAAWDANGFLYKFDESNTVKGWCKPDEVADFIAQIAAIEEYERRIYK